MRTALFFAGIFILAFSGLKAQEKYNVLMHEGNRSFTKKNYVKAAANYLQALKEKKDDFAAHYNLGNALYKQKMFDEAEAEYKKAERLSPNKTDKAAAFYNRGNALMKKNNSADAAKMYKNALKLDPYNETIRRNYQIAMLKEKEKQQQKQNQQQQKGGGGGKDNQNGDDNSKGKPQSNGSTGNQNNGNQGQGNVPKDQEQGSGNNLPKELEKQILKKSGEREKETSRKILNKDAYSMPRSNEKDW